MHNRSRKSATYPFSLAPLLFAYDALEPHIDAATMQIHHEKHHQSYITALNTALKPFPELHGLSIEELLQRCNELPVTIRQTVHDQGGGHLLHRFFWEILNPGPATTKPAGALAQAITRDFGSFATFKQRFLEVGVKHFGSGWVYLAVNTQGKLDVFSRSGHDHILLEGMTPLLINDLWEHAYYLKYQNVRAGYLNAFWNVVDWEFIGQRLESLYASNDRLRLAG